MPSIEKLIAESYGSVQKWFDQKVAEEFEGIYEAEVVKEKTEETITTEDF